MKTLFQPIHSLSTPHHHAADAESRNKHIGRAHNWLATPLHAEATSLTVSVPVPGMSKEDLHVYIDGQMLVVSTKGQPELIEDSAPLKGKDILCTFVLPAGVDANRVQAKCRKGLLTITLEKTKTNKSHRIIKVLGQENSGKNNRRLNTLWDTLKTKLDARKILSVRSNTHA